MDIIRLVLTRVQEEMQNRLGLSDQLADVLNLVDSAMRHEYGGERHYVSKTTEESIIESAARNRAIRKSWASGEPIDILSARHGISRRHLYRIVRGET